MIGRGLLTQIAMIGLAIGIAFYYIQPTFAEIGAMQDEITEYQSERQKVDEVNNDLKKFVDQLEGISSTDQQKLVTYIPDTVDTIAVPRLLQTIVEEAGMEFRNFTYDGIEQEYVTGATSSGVDDFPIPHSFTIDVEGSYQQLKALFDLLEQNEYPLEVHQLEITVREDVFLDVSLKLITFAHTQQSASPFENISN